MIPEQIKAKRGDLVLPKWRKLLDFIANTGIVAGPGVRITQGPNGTIVNADHFQKPWRHPFRVSLSGDQFTIREGLVNGLAPYVSDDARINGTDAEGEPIQIPELEFKYLETRRSAIVLDLTVQEGGTITIQDDPDNFRIRHLPVDNDDDDGLPEGEGIGNVKYPLARIYWNADGAVDRLFQIVHHNLGYRFLQGSSLSGRPVRHFFWAN